MCTTKTSESSEHQPDLHLGRRSFLTASLAGAPLLLQAASTGKGQARVNKGSSGGSTPPNGGSSSSMAAAAQALVAVLTPEQRARATFALDDPERQNWFYTPVARKGITIKDLDPAQRQLANVLLGAGLSQQGLLKAATVMSLEPILREIEQGKGPVRDPELYYFTLFGQPETPAPWAWRFEGHHISLHYAVTGRGVVASTPSFFGSNPSEVQQGPRKGLRALPREEDLARAFVKSLDDKQRAVAVVTDKAPADILYTNGRKADPIKPAGLQANKLGQKQSEMLMSLLREYASNVPPDIAEARMDRVRSGGFSNIFFAWAGQFEHLQPHYYRIQGPGFLIEYDCTQNNANHIHSV